MRLVHSVFVITNTLGVISIFKLISIFFILESVYKLKTSRCLFS